MTLHLGDCLEVLKNLPDESVDSLVTDPPAGISFMGKDWDGDKGGRAGWVAWMTEVMRECLRVLKPGAHGLVWAIPRTSHWTATALEDAGFEVRDVITHLFGQGFPKSLDISKAIDKANGDKRPVLTTISKTQSYGKQGNNTFGSDIDRAGKMEITSAASAASAAWSGWGTALKPASEHWILVRKPVSEKNVAANVLKWGTGGVNVDGCRVQHASADDLAASLSKNPGNADKFTGQTYGASRPQQQVNTSGRFPANLVLSHSPHCTDDQCDIECAIKALDEQSIAGGMHSAGKARSAKREASATGMFRLPGDGHRIGDSGGASRFFYCAKISPSERGEGNNHPTVKPQKLMRYLCRLITPPAGVVLDPFMGSGSTGMAAKAEGFQFVGIERDGDYFEIAKARIGT